jgi:hypothetical protein
VGLREAVLAKVHFFGKIKAATLTADKNVIAINPAKNLSQPCACLSPHRKHSNCYISVKPRNLLYNFTQIAIDPG